MKINQAGLGMAHKALGMLDKVKDTSVVFLRLRARLPEVLAAAQQSKNIRPSLFGRLKELVKEDAPQGWLLSLWSMVRCAVQNDLRGTKFHAKRVMRAVLAPSHLGALPSLVASSPNNAEAVAALAQANETLESFVNAKLGAAL